MGRFNGMKFDTAFAIGEMVRGVARKVRQVELQAPSSATLGPFAVESTGIDRPRAIHLRQSKVLLYGCGPIIFSRIGMVSEYTSNSRRTRMILPAVPSGYV